MVLKVKGVSEDKGGIFITGKEWEIAEKMKTDYYLILVSNIDDNPVISVYIKLFPKRNLLTVIQINWTASPSEIRQIIEKRL